MYRFSTAIVGCVALFALAHSTKVSAAAATPAQYAPTNAGQVQEVGYKRRWARRWGPSYGYGYSPYAYGYGYGYRPYGYYRPYAYYGRPYGYYGGPYAYYGGPYGYYRRPGISLGFAF